MMALELGEQFIAVGYHEAAAALRDSIFHKLENLRTKYDSFGILVQGMLLNPHLSGTLDADVRAITPPVLVDHFGKIEKQLREDTKFDAGVARTQTRRGARNQIGSVSGFDDFTSRSMEQFVAVSESNPKGSIFHAWIGAIGTQFPQLQKLALRLATIPASSASVERVFSLGRRLFNFMQGAISREMMEARMMLSWNKKFTEIARAKLASQ
jgi:hypothetical protein